MSIANRVALFHSLRLRYFNTTLRASLCSFDSLHDSTFIAKPSDEGALTAMGRFVTSIGLDLDVGRFVGIGCQFGLMKEVSDRRK